MNRILSIILSIIQSVSARVVAVKAALPRYRKAIVPVVTTALAVAALVLGAGAPAVVALSGLASALGVLKAKNAS